MKCYLVACRLHSMPRRSSLFLNSLQMLEVTDVRGYRCFVIALILAANVEVLLCRYCLLN